MQEACESKQVDNSEKVRGIMGCPIAAAGSKNAQGVRLLCFRVGWGRACWWVAGFLAPVLSQPGRLCWYGRVPGPAFLDWF